MPDMIEEGVTGWLAKSVDSAELSSAIGKGLASITSNGSEISGQCSEAARQKYDLPMQAEKYMKLYGNLIEQFSS